MRRYKETLFFKFLPNGYQWEIFDLKTKYSTVYNFLPSEHFEKEKRDLLSPTTVGLLKNKRKFFKYKSFGGVVFYYEL